MHESNPLLNWELYPDFPSISASHVVPAIQEVIARSSAELEALEQAAPRTWHGLLVPLERLTDRVSRAWGLATHLHNVKNSPNMREAYAQTQPLVVKFHNRLGQSRPVYDALVALRENPEFPDLSQALQRAITLLIRDAALQGVGLSPESRERFNAVSQELAELSTRFTNNVLDATQAYALTLTEKEQIQGLPQDSLRLAASMARARGREQATAENGPWCVTLDLPSFLSFMQHASRRDLREEVYRAYITRAASGDNDNLPLIRRILELQERANLLLHSIGAVRSQCTVCCRPPRWPRRVMRMPPRSVPKRSNQRPARANTPASASIGNGRPMRRSQAIAARQRDRNFNSSAARKRTVATPG